MKLFSFSLKIFEFAEDVQSIIANIYLVLRKAAILDGKKVAGEIQAELAVEVEKIVAKTGKAPHLSLVRVGSDPASGTYLKNKANAAKKIGK